MNIYGFELPDAKVYIYLAIVLLFRNLSEKFNYETIPTTTIKAGMILSNFSVIQMIPSKIKGLPTFSTEDMRSRLTIEQVESIKKWSYSKYGLSEVVIVRKIPFAIFMTLGVIVFLLSRLGVLW
jgi:preflagellin peptidase FlaK